MAPWRCNEMQYRGARRVARLGWGDGRFWKTWRGPFKFGRCSSEVVTVGLEMSFTRLFCLEQAVLTAILERKI
jgi:hypothetical protein